MTTALLSGRHRSFLNFPHISTRFIRINPFPRPPCASSLYETRSSDQSSAPILISSLPSAMASERHPIHSFLNPIRFHISTPLIRIDPFPRPRNPGRWISSSPHHLGSTQGYRRFRSWSVKFESLINSGKMGMEQQETSNKHENFLTDDPHPPAIVTCATVRANDFDEPDMTAFHFSTYNSDGAPLKLFSLHVHVHQPKVMSACRNLILFRANNAILCNIATQESITLPRINVHTAEVKGFGYVPSTKEFKVLGQFYHLELPCFKVLTLGTNQWRDVEDPPLPIRQEHQLITGGAFANGAIHFLTTTDQTILSFDLEREKWGWTAGPPVSSYHSLKELGGCLCVLNDYSRCIWWLDNNSGSWIMCTIKFPPTFNIKPLAIEHDGRIVLQWRHMKSPTEDSLLLYDPKAKSSREIQSFHTPLSEACFYIKVFSSLGHRG